MRESAATVEALGLGGALAGEIADVQARMGAAGSGSLAVDLATTVSATLRRRRDA
jgi:hypothetical protein